MKVCHITSAHPPFDVRIFHKECVSLAQAGHDVTLIAPADFQEQTVQGVRVLGVTKSASRTGRVNVWLEIARLVRQIKPEIVHFHDPDLLLVAPFLKARHRIYDCHERNAVAMLNKPWLPKPLQRPMYHLVSWLEPALARFTSGVIIVDDSQIETFESIGRPVVMVRNFPKTIPEKRRREPGQPKAAIHLGAQSRTRGTTMFVKAFSRVVQQLPDAQLWLVGSFNRPQYEAEIRALIQDLGLQNNVVITGALPYPDALQWLERASIGLVGYQHVAQYEQATPTKLLEYMAAGLPVVASDVQANRQFMEGIDCGYLLDPLDDRQFAEAMIRLFVDDDLAHAMGANGLRTALAKYNWNRQAETLLDLYAKLESGATASLRTLSTDHPIHLGD
jgi:glycosyltransferase involved in cell wall biosynthesis